MAQDNYTPSQRVCPPDKFDTEMDVFPSPNQTLNFCAGAQFEGQIKLSGSVSHCQSDDGFMPVGQLLRPKSPTQQCSIPEGDRRHFNLALMESKVGSKESDHIFHVQQHELICAISAQTSYVDSEGCVVSSVDINYYWCNFCTFSTATKQLLLQHVMEHRFHCKFCRYQSFSRADILHHSFHTHSDFKETAANTRYCTLLGDYLRMQHPKERQLDSQRKRKGPPDSEHDCSEQSQRKVRKADNCRRRQKTQEKYSSDYVCFDVGVEDKEETMYVAAEEMKPEETGSEKGDPVSLDEVRQVNENLLSLGSTSFSITSTHEDSTLLFSKCDSASDSTNQSTPPSFSPATAEDQQSTQTSCQSVFPPDLVLEPLPSSSLPLPGNRNSSSSSPCTSRSSTPSPPNLSTVSTGSAQQGLLDWVCAYCCFTSASRNGIKMHCQRQHRGKPVKYVSLDELVSAPPLLGCDGEKIPCAADQAGGVESSGEKAPVHQTASVSEPEIMENSPDQPPVLVKQRPVDLDVVDGATQNTHAPPVLAKSKMDLKCFHCKFRSHFLADLRNHIFISHKGKSLNGVDRKKKTVFLCSKSTCSFTSSSGQSFLNHVQECIPFSGTNPHFLEESVGECLQATTRLAEHEMLSLSSFSGNACRRENSDTFSCIHCKNPAKVSSKSDTKQHILDFHGSECLVMRNVYAHSRRKKSTVYFCKWCSWEGDQRRDYDMHGLFCQGQSGPVVKFNDQGSEQVSGVSCGGQDAQAKGGRIAFLESRGKSVCVKQDQGEGDDTGSVCLVPAVTSTAENSSEGFCDVNSQPSISMKASDFLCSNTADDQKPPVHTMIYDGLEGPVDEALSVPNQSTADDNWTTAYEVKSSECCDLNLSPVEATQTHSDMCRTPLTPCTTVRKDTPSAHLSAHSVNTVNMAVPLSDVILDSKSCDNSVYTSDTPSDFDTDKSSVQTNRTLSIDSFPNSEESLVLQDFEAVISREISDRAAKDCMYPPDISLDINTAGSSVSHSTVPSDLTSDIKLDLSPPDLSFSDVYMNAASASIDDRVTENKYSEPSQDVIPFGLTSIETRYKVPGLSVVGKIEDLSHNFSHRMVDHNVSQNECSASKSTVYEKETVEENRACSLNADLTGNSVKPAGKNDSQWSAVEKQAFSLEQDNKKDKKQGLKPTPSRRKKSGKNMWLDGYKVKCGRCSFLCDSLIFLKTHVQNKHPQMASVQFCSPYHKERHYKSNFFACPSLKCMVYNYSESIVVSHYIRSHSSQPHPYREASYTPAPVKSRRRNNGKDKKLPKHHAQKTSPAAKIQTEPTEQTYMCLYCERKVYTDTVSEMKAHHFSRHTGHPITIRNVTAHREKRTSRFYVCDQPQCDFCSYELNTLDSHMKMQHPQQPQADRSYQCAVCGWITSEDASVQKHVSAMHQSEGGATVVTLAHDAEQQTVEERYIVCASKAAAPQENS
ncbi:hypothetical protein ACOMHN_017655 [Nucella lapillus]